MSQLLALLLLAVPGAPALAALLTVIPGARGHGVRAAPWAAAPALVLALVAFAAELDDVRMELAMVFTGLHLALDPVGRAFLLFTSLLWLAAGLFARSYHSEDPKGRAFLGFFALTMAGSLGLVVAADLLSFYLFFAVMTFAAYGLVVHRRDGEALRAGRVYIALAVVGELLLLAGLFPLGAAAQGIPLFGSDLEGVWRELLAPGAGGTLIGLLLLGGFAVKAGLVPLHTWLPLAHPVAPTAASALLSGAMIKGGLLGWLRVLPGETAFPAAAALFLAAGALTALYGVAMGLPQRDPKTVLAYSSVSQMGFMAIGMGILLANPELGDLAVAGIVFYALHHGLAKGALFLSVGVLDRSPSSRRWRAGILLAASLPALALAGLPFTTGALAKGVLKGGLVALGGARYALLDPLLLLAAFGTTLLMARFLFTLSRRGSEAGGEHPASAPDRGLVVPWLVLLGAVLLGILWLPWAFPVPEGVMLPRLLEGFLAALLPVGAGALLGWMVWRRPSLAGPLRRLRIPPGDVLVPLERAFGARPRPDQEAAVSRLRGAAEGLLVARDASFAVLRWLAVRDLRSLQGTVLAGTLLGLAVLLVLLLVLS